MNAISFLSHLCQECLSCPSSYLPCRIGFHVPASPAVCVYVCLQVCVLCGNVGRLANGQFRETLLFKVDTSLMTLAPASSRWRLPSLIYDPDPQPEILLVTSLTHTDRHTHTPVPDQLWEITFTNGVILSLLNSSSTWPSYKALHCCICKFNECGLTIWYWRLAIGIYSMLATDFSEQGDKVW